MKRKKTDAPKAAETPASVIFACSPRGRILAAGTADPLRPQCPHAFARSGRRDRRQHPVVWLRQSHPGGEGGDIIAGHGRLAAARQLGMTEAPVIVLSGLSDIQRRQLVLADNRIAANGGWDAQMLALELSDLRGPWLRSQAAWLYEGRARSSAARRGGGRSGGRG